MQPSKDEFPDLATLPSILSSEHSWSIAQAQCDGAPLIIRFSETAANWQGHPGLPIKLGFAVPLNQPDEQGLPTPEENSLLDEVEDVIVREVAAGVTGIHALTLTTGTMKEFVFYISPGADIAAIHQTIQNSVDSHNVQCMAVMEPEWDSWRQFTP